MKSQELAIKSVCPTYAVPGGEITISCQGFEPGLPDSAQVLFGESRAEILSASAERVVVRVPENWQAPGIMLRVHKKNSPVFPCILASRVATDLHPVANPVVAPDGAVITTISGSRGQRHPQSLMRVSRDGAVEALPCEILNPTGLAFGPDGQLYISSRADGTILRYTNFEHLDTVAEDLGVPCGIVFDREGALYVGDRTGNIYRIDSAGTRIHFATLPPSVSAFHLAVDAERSLYVTGPTLTMRDPLYRIDRAGKIEILLQGFARPQGLAFSPEGDLWIATAFAGKKGVFRYSFRSKELVHQVAGPTLVGLAFDVHGSFLADNHSIYRLQMGLPSGNLIDQR